MVAQNPDLPVCVQYGPLSSRVEIPFKGKVTYSRQKILVYDSSGDVVPSRKNFVAWSGQKRPAYASHQLLKGNQGDKNVVVSPEVPGDAGPWSLYKFPFSFSSLQGHLPGRALLWKDWVDLGRNSFPPICAYTKSAVKYFHITWDNNMPVPSAPTLHVGQGQRDGEENLRHTHFT